MTTGDVVFFLQRETWAGIVGRHFGAMGASIVVLAATARIGPVAARNILLDDWETGQISVPTRTGQRTPILLPIAREIVRRYLPLRPENAGPWLFVNGEGNQLFHTDVDRVFEALGRQCGIPGTVLPRRCLQYFDRCFDNEDDDRAAVVALSGWRNRAVDSEVTKQEVADAAADEDRLRGVLDDNHPFAGAAAQFLGAEGTALAAETQAIFRSQDRVPKVFSPVVLIDPVCIALHRTAWPRLGKKTLRLELKAAYFDHIAELRKAGLIRIQDIAYLFSCAARTVESWIQKSKARTEADLEEERRWIAEAPQMYLERRRGEKPAQFHKRLTADHDCNLSFIRLMNILTIADVLKPRKRSQPAAAAPAPHP